MDQLCSKCGVKNETNKFIMFGEELGMWSMCAGGDSKCPDCLDIVLNAG